MTNYYIYHVPGIKIGVTTNVPRRMREQRFTEWEHLETHTCVYEVSDREQELQRQYGLPVDQTPYHITYFKNKKDTQRAKISESKKGHTHNLGKRHTTETKQKMSIDRRTTTPEFDALVIQDRLLGMTMRELASKHNIGYRVVRRIIRDINE